MGCQSAEIYDNTFSAEGLKMGRPQGFIFVAGGVAMVFNNTVTGTTYNTRTIQVSHERSFWPHWRVWDLRRHEPHGRQRDSGGPERGRLSSLRPTGPGNGCRRRRRVRTIALLRLEQHAQWGEAEHGAAPLGESGTRQRNRQRTSRKGGISSTRSPSPNTISRTSIRIRCKAAGRR